MANRKQRLFLGLILLLSAPTLSAQANCRPLLNDAQSTFAGGKGDLRNALRILQDVEICDIKNDLLRERQALQTQIFNAIEKQKQDEQNARKAASDALDDAREANRIAQMANDSLQKVLLNLGRANADKVCLILSEVERNQTEQNFDAAVDKIKTARILNALPDTVNKAYRKLSLALLGSARSDLGNSDYLSALTKIKSAAELNSIPDSVAAANQLLRNYLYDNARQDLINTRFDAALDKINAVNGLEKSKEKVWAAYFEIAYCFSETGRLERAAGILDTIIHLRKLKTSPDLCHAIEGKTPAEQRQRIRQARRELSPELEKRLTERYFPQQLVNIPAGSFSAGVSACPVPVNAFALSPREVTFFEYDLFCASENRSRPSDNGWGRGARPVVDVDWYDAIEYCNWRSQQEGLQEVYSLEKSPDSDAASARKWQVRLNAAADGYRLPTEAEWEFAAGNGEKHTRYSWGNEAPQAQKGGNVADETVKPKFPEWTIFEGYSDGQTYTAPVGMFDANTFGVYDMSGNVWEWCWDAYSNDICQSGKTGAPAPDAERVLRGGSWGSYPEDCTVSRRLNGKPDKRNFSIGFRIARTPGASSSIK